MNENAPDRRKTLTELEGEDWGPPDFGLHLVATVHQLRYKPLAEFTVADLQICIGQNMALEWLLPIAIEHLMDDPLVEGDYYRGDLLNSVMTIKQEFWSNHPDVCQRIGQIAERALARRPELDSIETEVLDQGLKCFRPSASTT